MIIKVYLGATQTYRYKKLLLPEPFEKRAVFERSGSASRAEIELYEIFHFFIQNVG